MLHDKIHYNYYVITLDEKDIYLYNGTKIFNELPTKKHNIILCNWCLRHYMSFYGILVMERNKHTYFIKKIMYYCHTLSLTCRNVYHKTC
jgi:hypothetical protein